MKRISKKSAVLGSLVALIAAAAAYAYWSTTGSGTGSAGTSAGAANLTVTETSTIGNMFPGDVAQNITGTVKNLADNNAYVTQVAVSISGVTKASGAPAGTCDASDYTLSNATMTVGQDLAKNGTANFSGATIKFNNKGSNQDACKGATVNLAYAAS